jgi:hypothetical protein
MPSKTQKSKEETRAAIEKEIASITTDLERLRAIIHHATGDQSESSGEPVTTDGRHTDTLVN